MEHQTNVVVNNQLANSKLFKLLFDWMTTFVPCSICHSLLSNQVQIIKSRILHHQFFSFLWRKPKFQAEIINTSYQLPKSKKVKIAPSEHLCVTG